MCHSLPPSVERSKQAIQFRLSARNKQLSLDAPARVKQSHLLLMRTSDWMSLLFNSTDCILGPKNDELYNAYLNRFYISGG